MVAKFGFDTAENEPSKVLTCLPASPPLPTKAPMTTAPYEMSRKSRAKPRNSSRKLARTSNEEDTPWRRPCYIHSAPRRILAAESAPPLRCLGWGATIIMLPSGRLIILLRWHVQGGCLGSYDIIVFLMGTLYENQTPWAMMNISPRLRRGV